MKRILIGAVLLALPFVAFLVWFEAGHASRENNAYLLKRNRLQRVADQVEVLVMGSSQEHDGVLPGWIGSNTFNLAAVSQSIYYDAELLRRIVPTLPNLKLVVWPVSYFSLQSELADGAEAWRGYYYRRYHGIWQPDYHAWLEARNFSLWYLYGRQFGLDAVLGRRPRLVSADYDAWGGRNPTDESWRQARSPEYLERAAGATLARHDRMLRPGRARDQEWRMASTIGWLRGRGVKVVLIQSPLTAWYRDGRSPEVLEANRIILDRLTSGGAVRQFDFTADERFAATDFQDGNHLNFGGAVKFSEILRREVIEPALRAD